MKNLKSYTDFVNEAKKTTNGLFKSDVDELLNNYFVKVKNTKYKYKDEYVSEVEFNVIKDDFIIEYKTLNTDFDSEVVLNKRKFVPVLIFVDKNEVLEDGKKAFKMIFKVDKEDVSDVKIEKVEKKKDAFKEDSDKSLLKKLKSRNTPDYTKEDIMDELKSRGVDFKNPFEFDDDDDKANESIEDYDNDDDFLNSPEYFVETYFNGNFSQLRDMLEEFKEDGRMKELNIYLDEIGNTEIKNWIIENEESDDIIETPTYEHEDEEYLDSPEYFVETYFNGNFSQLRDMLEEFKEDGRMKELNIYLDEIGNTEIKNWIIENEESDDIIETPTYEHEDEEYLDSPEYFVETYINGNFSQLRDMLKRFKKIGKIKELNTYLNDIDNTKIKNWVIDNIGNNESVLESVKVEETIIKFGSDEWNKKYNIILEEEKKEKSFEELVSESLVKKVDNEETLSESFNKIFEESKPKPIETIQK